MCELEKSVQTLDIPWFQCTAKSFLSKNAKYRQENPKKPRIHCRVQTWRGHSCRIYETVYLAFFLGARSLRSWRPWRYMAFLARNAFLGFGGVRYYSGVCRYPRKRDWGLMKSSPRWDLAEWATFIRPATRVSTERWPSKSAPADSPTASSAKREPSPA